MHTLNACNHFDSIKMPKNVQDVNDNPHQFTQLHYNAAVNEGALPGKNVQ